MGQGYQIHNTHFQHIGKDLRRPELASGLTFTMPCLQQTAEEGHIDTPEATNKHVFANLTIRHTLQVHCHRSEPKFIILARSDFMLERRVIEYPIGHGTAHSSINFKQPRSQLYDNHQAYCKKN